MKLRDEKLKNVQELLANMKILKLYNWECQLGQRVTDIRGKELKALAKLFGY